MGTAPSTSLGVESERFRSISASQRVIVAVGKSVSWYRPARRVNRNPSWWQRSSSSTRVRRQGKMLDSWRCARQRLGPLEARSVVEFGAGYQLFGHCLISAGCCSDAARYSGELPCLRSTTISRLSCSTSRAAEISARVSAGSMTASMKPRSAAT